MHCCAVVYFYKVSESELFFFTFRGNSEGIVQHLHPKVLVWLMQAVLGPLQGYPVTGSRPMQAAIQIMVLA